MYGTVLRCQPSFLSLPVFTPFGEIYQNPRQRDLPARIEIHVYEYRQSVLLLAICKGGENGVDFRGRGHWILTSGDQRWIGSFGLINCKTRKEENGNDNYRQSGTLGYTHRPSTKISIILPVTAFKR